MFVASTLNADNKSRELVRAVVVSYAGRRKFVVKSEEYQQTIESVRKAFDIRSDTPVTLSTSSLDVCRGQPVEIDEIAYPLLWEFVDEVAITTPEETASTGPNATRRQSRISAITATARRSLAFTARLSDVKGLPLRSLSSSTASERPPQNNTQEERAQEDLVEAELLRVVAQEQEEEDQYEHVEEPVSNPSLSTGIDNIFDDDYVEEIPRPSRQQAKEPSPPPTPSPKPKKSAATLPPGEPRAKPELQVKTEKPDPKKSKFKPKTEPEPKVKSKAEAAPEGRRPRDASPAPRSKASASAAVKDSRISIVISGPTDDLSAQFKMRGKHQIHKILKTACANFKLEFERATLHLIHEDEEDENGDPVFSELPRNKTALECGIMDGARLVIHIEGDDEEEEEEEDDDDDY